MANFFEGSHPLLYIHHVCEAIKFAFKKEHTLSSADILVLLEKFPNHGPLNKLVKKDKIPFLLKIKLTKTERIREFNKIVALFGATSIEEIRIITRTINYKIFTYLNKNWLPIISQWVPILFPKRMHLGLTTSNRVESIFSKMKPNTTESKNFLEFFNHFLSHRIIKRKYLTDKLKENTSKNLLNPKHL